MTDSSSASCASSARTAIWLIRFADHDAPVEMTVSGIDYDD
jgi:hypothetical protein